jgi:hypothetical protein
MTGVVKLGYRFADGVLAAMAYPKASWSTTVALLPERVYWA